MHNLVTLREVAAAAGVGVATASRALSGDRRCASETRNRVKTEAERLGYAPDPWVAALARRRGGRPKNSYPLVWLTDRDEAPVGQDLTLVEVLRREAGARGYTLAVERVGKLGGPVAAGRALYARGVVGVFVSPLIREEVVKEFPWDRFAVVSFLQEDFGLPFDTVRPDMFYMMFHAWVRARASGARRIGAVIPSSYVARENELLLSACAFHQRDLPESAPPLILQPTRDGCMAHYTERTAEWFFKYRPDVVIGKTIGAYWALHSAGLRCPHDYRFITLNWVSEHAGQAGFDWQRSLLAEALMSRMHTLVSLGWRGRREAPGTWTIEGAWRAGESFPEA